jgi:hypothetical protein
MPAWLLHPLPLVAILLTAINDHVLKGSGLLPGWLTGKLSDFTGLFFFPVAAAAVLRAKGTAARTIIVAATGALFALFKTSPAACAWLAPLARVTPDITDLIALPMVALAWLWMARWRPSPCWNGPAWTRTVAVGAAALTSAATSPVPRPYYYRPLPLWSTVGAGRQPLSCADVELWVSKSGRQGIGITVAFEPRGAPCTIRLDRLALVVPGQGEFTATSLLGRVEVRADQPAYRYIPLPFDNAAAWSRHDHTGFVRLDVTAPDGPHALRFDVVHAQAPRPSWGTFWRSGAIVTGVRSDGLHMVLRLDPGTQGPLRLERAELLAGDAPIVVIPLNVDVDPAPDEQAEVPIFLPFDTARWSRPARNRLTLRVALVRDGQEPTWLRADLYAPSEDRAP